jgi:ABC-type transport system involved in cytochrome c biogenesis ATPase subunit
MKIESVYIEDLWKLKQLQVSFQEPETKYFDQLKISVLVGEKGTGKTSLLKFLSGVFYYPYLYRQGMTKGYELQYSVNGQSYRLDASMPFHSRGMEGPMKVIVSTHSLFEAFTRNQPDKASEVEYVYLSPSTSSASRVLRWRASRFWRLFMAGTEHPRNRLMRCAACSN